MNSSALIAALFSLVIGGIGMIVTFQPANPRSYWKKPPEGSDFLDHVLLTSAMTAVFVSGLDTLISFFLR